MSSYIGSERHQKHLERLRYWHRRMDSVREAGGTELVLTPSEYRDLQDLQTEDIMDRALMMLPPPPPPSPTDLLIGLPVKVISD